MIRVENLSFQYPKSEVNTLKSINFNIDKAEVFGFLGPSGAGKSTAQKILYKILSGYTGLVEIDGKNLKNWDKKYLEKIGVGFELPNHYLKLTGKENLELFASFYPTSSVTKTQTLFEMVDLQEAMNKPVESYSKGMKMRLNFIRALQHNPEILFFDEPTSGLDPVNAQKLMQHILHLKNQGKTIFITTHDMHIADELCDRVAFIVDGALRIIDSPANLKTKYGKEAVSVHLKDGTQQEFPLAQIGQNQFFSEFIKRGEVSKMKTLDATLEEVFIKVTGKSLTK